MPWKSGDAPIGHGLIKPLGHIVGALLGPNPPNLPDVPMTTLAAAQPLLAQTLLLLLHDLLLLTAQHCCRPWPRRTRRVLSQLAGRVDNLELPTFTSP